MVLRINYVVIIIINIIIDVSCHRPFLPGTSLEPAVIPTAQASSLTLQYFPYYESDVPSIAVFCSESIESFPGTAPKFFFRLLVTIPVAPIITGIIVHFGLLLLLLLAEVVLLLLLVAIVAVVVAVVVVV